MGGVEGVMIAQRKMRWLHQGLGLLVSIACLWLVARQVRFDQLRQAWEQLDSGYVGLGLGFLAFGYAMRIRRWAAMLHAAGAHVSSRACIAPFLGAIMLNNVLPFRAGDVVRALVFPASLRVRRTTAAASLLLERLLDLLTLLLGLGIGLSLGTRAGVPPWLARGLLMLSLLGVAALLVVVICHSVPTNALAGMRQAAESRGWIRIASLLEVAGNLMRGLDRMSRPSILLWLFTLSIAAWAGEAGLFRALLEGFGLHLGIASALLIMAMATLATLLPSSPGYVGTFHLAAYTAVTMLGGSPAQAASFAVLAHLCVWLPTTLAGGIALLANPGLLNARASREPSF